MNHAHDETVWRCRHTGRIYRTGENAGRHARVTLSDDLLNHLRQTAQVKHVPLHWLVAGLVCDTFESGIERSVDHQVTATGH
jgi:hypothetical protein